IASCAAIPDWYLQYRRALSEGVQALDNVRLPSPNPLTRLSFTRLRQRGQQAP
ncbi:MAG: hypothetical protein JWM47_3950, partial [Acidimicrobiales bacterium]|nr:hypothetical protein [Acidimicrobiales bacterium]